MLFVCVMFDSCVDVRFHGLCVCMFECCVNGGRLIGFVPFTCCVLMFDCVISWLREWCAISWFGVSWLIDWFRPIYMLVFTCCVECCVNGVRFRVLSVGDLLRSW